MISHGVKSVISLYVVDNLLAVVNDRAFDGADAHPMGRISGDLLLDGDVESIKGEIDSAQCSINFEDIAGGAYRGCAVDVGCVGGDNILFRFAAAKRGEKQNVCGKSREPRVEGREGFHRSDMSLYSAVASKEGQAFGAKWRCPYIRALGYRAFSVFRSWRRAVFCIGVRVSLGANWPSGSRLVASQPPT